MAAARLRDLHRSRSIADLADPRSRAPVPAVQALRGKVSRLRVFPPVCAKGQNLLGMCN